MTVLHRRRLRLVFVLAAVLLLAGAAVSCTKPPGNGSIIGPALGNGSMTLFLDGCTTLPDGTPAGAIVENPPTSGLWEFQVPGVSREIRDYCVKLDYTDVALVDETRSCTCGWSKTSNIYVCACP